MAHPHATPTPEPTDMPGSGAADPPQDLLHRIVRRPDGLHWIAPDGHQEFGPYESLDDVLTAMGSGDGARTAEELAEVERALGLADWIDPETGIPAEDTTTRLEEE